MGETTLVVVANTRFPSHRAQALQVAETSAAFQRAGVATTLFVADRVAHVDLGAHADPFAWYGIREHARPKLVRVPCVDWIERVPRVLQYVPARLQELTFARNAARRILRESPSAIVISRELECARHLVRGGSTTTFLEIHRVPGGRTRRRWLFDAATRVRGIIAISEGVRADLLDLGIAAGGIVVEHDGFAPERFADRHSRADARRSLGLPVEAPLVVYTGGLLAWKGVDVLIEAARLVPSAYFVVAGGLDADVARIRALAGGLQNVRIDGFQPPDKIPTYLEAGDVGVVPNRSQPAISSKYTSPLKVFESMAAGLPLVASDVPSLASILRRDLDAVLVAPDDPAALARGIERVLGDAELRARMSASLRARAGEHTWDARAERVLAWMRARSVG